MYVIWLRTTRYCAVEMFIADLMFVQENGYQTETFAFYMYNKERGM
jgi:hypothetical protein